LNKKGEFGAYSIKPGFEYAVAARGKNRLFPSAHFG
jgi:hypothetical protein